MFVLKKGIVCLLGILFVYFAAFVSHVWGDLDWNSSLMRQQKILPDNLFPDQQNPTYFGSSIALSDKYAIIGAKKDSEVVQKGGAVFIYEKTKGKWVYVKKFIGSQTQASTYLGIDVALSDNYAFAGAFDYDLSENHKDVGIVYVFHRQTSGEWIELQTLTPDVSTSEDTHKFGCSIAVCDDQLIVGAYGKRKESGKAFIYELENNQWKHRQTIQPDDPDIIGLYGGQFGKAVDISTHHAIVGTGIGYDGIGAVFIYKKQNGLWQEVKQIMSSDENRFSYFGEAVVINDKYAIVGAYEDNDTGSIYLYQLNDESWDLIQKYSEPGLIDDDNFGESIALYGNTVAVGAKNVNYDSKNIDFGAVYIYRIENETITLQKKVIADQPKSEFLFGNAVSLCREGLLVGTESNSHAYFFSLYKILGADAVLGLDDVVHLLKIVSESPE